MNAIRPEGYEFEKNDCTVRALSNIANIEYKQVHKLLKDLGRKDRHSFYFLRWCHCIFNRLNLSAEKIPQRKTITVTKFIKRHPKGRYLCRKRAHLFCIIDGQAFDIVSNNVRITDAWKITLSNESG